jgi:hypothetical protein
MEGVFWEWITAGESAECRREVLKGPLMRRLIHARPAVRQSARRPNRTPAHPNARDHAGPSWRLDGTPSRLTVPARTDRVELP